MEYVLLFFTIVFICLLIHYKTDMLSHTQSILKDRFFFTILIYPIFVAFILSTPMWVTTEFLFTVQGYENFIQNFKLPLILVGLSSTIAAIYGFIHTSKQRDHELEKINDQARSATYERQLVRFTSWISTAATLELNLMKIQDHIVSLEHMADGTLPNDKKTVEYDIQSICTLWESIYIQSPQYFPAMSLVKNELRDINVNLQKLLNDLKDLIELDDYKTKKTRKMPIRVIRFNHVKNQLRPVIVRIRDCYEQYSNWFNDTLKKQRQSDLALGVDLGNLYLQIENN